MDGRTRVAAMRDAASVAAAGMTTATLLKVYYSDNTYLGIDGDAALDELHGRAIRGDGVAADAVLNDGDGELSLNDGAVRDAITDVWLAAGRAADMVTLADYPNGVGDDGDDDGGVVAPDVCPECDMALGDMDARRRDWHVVRWASLTATNGYADDARPIVLVGCEGYYLPAFVIGYRRYLTLAARRFALLKGDRVVTRSRWHGGTLGTVTATPDPTVPWRQRVVEVVWDGDDANADGYEDEIGADMVTHTAL